MTSFVSQLETSKHIKRLNSLFKNDINKSILKMKLTPGKFYIKDIKLFEGVKLEKEFIKPPFPVTVIEYRNTATPQLEHGKLDMPNRIILIEDFDSKLVFRFYYGLDESFWEPTVLTATIKINNGKTDGEVLYNPVDASLVAKVGGLEVIQNQAKEIEEELNVYCAFISYLSQAIPCMTTRPFSKRTSITKKAKGYQYRELSIDNKKYERVKPKGTHASPTKHLRRGHYRVSSLGKKYWVKAHSVGKEGFVHKTYLVKGEI
jgi:hypothetical protein